jgi:quinol-cytochrome oxidoreductase complex cytochrome b subunit
MVRNLHYWAGQAMVGCLVLHMARVVVTGSYAPPRRLNWIVGLILLILTILTDFTGYILRWDGVGRTAATVGVNIMEQVPWLGPRAARIVAGGEPLGQTALLRYYIFHSFLLPGSLALGIMYHFWRVREDGRMQPL